MPTPYQAFAQQALAVARQFVVAGKLFVAMAGKQEIFFARDPLLTVDQVVRSLISSAPVDEATIKAHLAREAPGHETLLKAWLEEAIAQGRLFEHPASPGTRKKRYGLNRPVPDVSASLKSVLTQLRKALTSTDAKGVPREVVANALLSELGLSPLPGAPAQDGFLEALNQLATDNPGQALLSVRDLRARTGLGKEQFDKLALDLSRQGVISLHHHDHPASLSDLDREQLVRDARGTHYIGIAVRRA
ncbi:MAG: hypothetical protein ABUL62_16880 [Myxococcales bacterium]